MTKGGGGKGMVIMDVKINIGNMVERCKIVEAIYK